jgi:hypothetical protein
VQERFQLAPISLGQLAGIAVLAAAITGLAEIAKRWNRTGRLRA